MSSSRLISLGVITAPHGVRGQVKIRSFTADPADLTSYGKLQDKNGKIFTITVTGHTKDVLIAWVEGVNTRDDAEKLRNIELYIPRSALPAAKEHEYYYEDLVGLTVMTEDGKEYGKITAMYNFGAGDLVYISRTSGEEEIISFSKAAFPTIDIAEGIVIFVPPQTV